MRTTSSRNDLLIAPCRVIRSPATVGRGSPENVFSFSPGLPDRTGRGIDISYKEWLLNCSPPGQDVRLPVQYSRRNHSLKPSLGLGIPSYTASGGPAATFCGNGRTAISRIATASASTSSTMVNTATPGHWARLHATPPADPSTLDPTYMKNE